MLSVPRQMATWNAIEEFHAGKVSRYRCVRCHVKSKCERAHLVDHALGGSGDPDNLLPLCHNCHRVMPSFGPGEDDAARAWIKMDAYGYMCATGVIDRVKEQFKHLSLAPDDFHAGVQDFCLAKEESWQANPYISEKEHIEEALNIVLTQQDWTNAIQTATVNANN